MQKHRILTNIGKDNKITVELKQDYELLEILSLKFSQKDAYASFCSDYGVVCGRISVNNGLGIPNARVSIFIPLKDEHKNDPVISALYPYKEADDKNEAGYKYNLLPTRKQHGGHEPTGTFFDQTDILTREEVLEVFETYYSYTVKTNEAGDFMIWGVPLGNQTLHVDVDLSDIGAFSLRPYDLMRQGAGVDKFKNKYKFKSSEDLITLPQIVSYNKSIEVYPFWGNEDYCEIGLTRTDFDLSERGISIKPKAFLIGGVYTDGGKNSINKNCIPGAKMGRKCDLLAKSAKVELIRFTPTKDENYRPVLEEVVLNEDIPDDGAFVIPLEMNMDYTFTNEFGENEITNDPNKGVATSACYRTRINISDNDLSRVRQNADFLIPNIREYGTYNGTSWIIDDKSYSWSLDWDDYPTTAVSDDSSHGILYNENGEYFPKDYFYRFNYNKVYTVSSFQSSFHNDLGFLTKDRFLGLKELSPAEEEDCGDTVTPPINFGLKNYTFTLLISDVLLFLDYLINLIVLLFVNAVARAFQAIGDFFYELCLDLGSFGSICPFKGLGIFFKKIGYGLAESGQKSLYLVTYPECVECNNENQPQGNITSPTTQVNFCEVGTFEIDGLVYSTFDFTQSTLAIDWIVVHNHNDSNPTVSVTATNSLGGTPTYNVVILDNFTLKITFDSESIGTATITKTSLTANRIKVPTNISYSIPDVGQCVGSATSITSEADFVDMQSNYLLNVNSQNYSLDSGQGYFFINQYDNKIYFNDESGILPLSQVYSVRILDKNSTDNGNQSQLNLLESGCELYDSTYDDDITSSYYLAPNRTPSATYNPRNGDVLQSSKLSDVSKWNLPTYFEGSTYIPITPSGWCEFFNGVFYMIPGSVSSGRIIASLWEYYRRKRIGKMFCGGIVNYAFIDNWLSGSLYFFQFKAKRMSDAVNKSNEGIAKYCREVVRFVTSQGRFYYRSAKFNGTFVPSVGTFGNSGNYKRIGTPTTFVDLGPRDEFIKEITTDPKLDVNSSVVRSIGATSYHNFGELLGLTINYRLDSNDNKFALADFFTNVGFKDSINFYNVLDGDILQLISINSEAGIEPFDLQSPKYLGYSYQKLDPDIYPEVFKTNGYYGATPITLEFNDDGERIRSSLNEPGRLTESSQIVPFYLWDKKGRGFGGYNQATSDDQSWDYSDIQTQPLQGMTYGYSYTGTYDDPSDKYLLLPITYDYSGLTIPGNVTTQIEFDDVILKTTTNLSVLLQDYNTQYPGYTVLAVTSGTVLNPTSGVLYTRRGPAGNDGVTGWASQAWDVNIDFIIRPTSDYYSGNKQILSTPFQFYFGLKAGKTGLDKFIDLFGPKGAFPPAE